MLHRPTTAGLCVCLGAALANALPPPRPKTVAPETQALLERAPLHFEANRGQFDARVKYHAKASGYALFLGERGAVIAAPGGSVRLTLPRSNPRPTLEALAPQRSTTTYFRGRNAPTPAVPHFGRVRYRAVYPGIDLVYYGAGRQVEYDFVVAPGADPSRIRVRFEGAKGLAIEDGELVFQAGSETLRQRRPRVYQKAGDRVEEVAGAYRLTAPNEVAFTLGDWDRSRELVIDPVLEYSSFLGGSNRDVATAAAIDNHGRVWVTGYTRIIDFPTTTGPYGVIAGLDVFVARLNPSRFGAETLEYLAFLGGSSDDQANAIYTDEAGGVYIAGSTNSFDFPLGGEAKQTGLSSGMDAFVAKLGVLPDDSIVLFYSSYLGGPGEDVANAVAGSPNGKLYVAGYTTGAEFPTTPNALQPINRGAWDAFVAVFDLTKLAAETLAFSSFFGGWTTDIATAVGFDREGKFYVAGFTASDDFPVTAEPFFNIQAGRGDAFIARFDLTKSGLDTLDYCTYYGGTDLDVPYAMKVLPDGVLYLAGYTLSINLPLAGNPIQFTNAGGNSDVFVSRFDLRRPGRDALTFGTYLGGGGGDVAYGVDVDQTGLVYVTGYTTSRDFPLIGSPVQSVYLDGGSDAFVTIMDIERGAFLYSTYLGSRGVDAGFGIAVDNEGNIFVAGTVQGDGFPITEGNHYKREIGGTSDAFVVKLRP
jgi:hypothetical protein